MEGNRKGRGFEREEVRPARPAARDAGSAELRNPSFQRGGQEGIPQAVRRGEGQSTQEGRSEEWLETGV